jgi:L-asparaginase/Glu-tRNA(Gln) amidotransferase subunit D
MSLDQTFTTQAKFIALQQLATGTLKIALYTAAANINADTLVYTTTDEVVGTGYVAGGKILTGVTVSKSGTTAYLDFANVTWDPANFTARGALIYNTSLGNLAVAVLDFGADKTATTTFTVQMPENNSSSALLRLN